MKQLTQLRAKVNFQYKLGPKGRWCQAKAGELYWVTNTEASQNSRAQILIDRIDRGRVGTGYPFTLATINELFDIAE